MRPGLGTPQVRIRETRHWCTLVHPLPCPSEVRSSRGSLVTDVVNLGVASQWQVVLGTPTGQRPGVDLGACIGDGERDPRR